MLITVTPMNIGTVHTLKLTKMKSGTHLLKFLKISFIYTIC